MPLLYKIDGYEIWKSDRPGKAVKGRKRTNGIQVRLPCDYGYFLKKNFQYDIDNSVSKQKAIEKAKNWIEKNPLPF